MIYWDSSALISLLIFEKQTKKVQSFIEQAGEVQAYTSVITPLEIESAFKRRLKEKSVTVKQANAARELFSDFRKYLYLIPADQTVLDMALHLLKLYDLKPADALQLASARAGTHNPSIINFLSLDQKLNKTAKQEGFDAPFLLA